MTWRIMSKQWDQWIECHKVGSTKIMGNCGWRKKYTHLRFWGGWR